ncbi:transposase domain-containing protein [Desulfonatronum parangueonense]
MPERQSISLIEIAKANRLNPYLYLLHVFTTLPQSKTNSEIRQLLPQNLTSQKLEELTAGILSILHNPHDLTGKC